MAAKFWVGGGPANLDGVDTTHISDTSGGAGGAVYPVAGDTLTFDGASGGGTVTFTAGLTITTLTAGAFTGTINTNGQAVAVSGVFSISGTGARTITLGASAITCGTWTATTTTNLTFNANTSTITQSGATTFDGGGLPYATTILTGTAPTIAGTNSHGALTRTGTATKTDTLTLSANQTVTGLFTATGNSVTNRLLIQSSVLGTPRTITCTNPPVLSNVDFMDITGAGAASPFTGTSLGDCLGNSGITFTPSATQTFAGGTKSWSDITAWTSRVPLPQDDVIVNTTAAGTLTADMPRLGRNIDFTGFTRTLSQSVAARVYGSLTLASGMTFSSTNIYFAGRSSHTLTSAGKSYSQTILFEGPGGTYTLQDALTGGLITSFQVLTGSTLNANGFAVAMFGGTVTAAALQMGSGLWTVFGYGTIWSIAASATITPSTSTLKFTDTTSAVKTFAGGGKTYNNAWLSGTGPFAITGSNTFADLKVDPGLVVRSTAGTTQTVTTANISGRAAIASDHAYGLLDGAAGSVFSTPDSATVSVTGSIEVEVLAQMGNWTSGLGDAIAVLASKFGGVGQQAWAFYITGTTGKLRFASSNDGTALPVNVLSSVSLSTVFASGAWGWLKVTMNASTGQVEFLTAPDASGSPGSYTRLGTLPAAVGATSIFDNTTTVTIGERSDGSSVTKLIGKIGRARIYNGIGGTLVADFNPSLWTSGNTFTASTGETWTRNGNAMFSADNLTTLQGLTASTWTLAKAGGGTLEAWYLALRNSTATPTATWYAIASKDGGNNSGWNFFASGRRSIPIYGSRASYQIIGSRASYHIEGS